MNKQTIIEVNSEHHYEVVIDAHYLGEIESIAARHERVLMILPQELADLFGMPHHLQNLPNVELAYVDSGEGQKSFSTLERLWGVCADQGLTRSDAIIGLGGGATTDLAGFVAASWLRGISWYAIPTTLAAMVDAAIGGKTAINSPAGKNLIGAFHSPKRVIIDLSFLSTLSDRDFAAGLAEVIKVGFIQDREILDLLARHPSIEQARLVATELIARSVQVKASVVSADFQESALREILNYGHTFGHALEKHEHYLMRHGECVSVGLIFAAHLSVLLQGLSEGVLEQHYELLSQFGLPVSTDVDFESLYALMSLDKKSRGARIRFIALNSVGSPHWLEDVSKQQLLKAYESLRNVKHISTKGEK